VHWALVEARGWGGERREGGAGPFIGVIGRFEGGDIFLRGGRRRNSISFSMRRPVTRRLERRQVNLCRLGAARAVVEQDSWLVVVAVLGDDRSADALMAVGAASGSGASRRGPLRRHL
jgi:hypothetical protein